MPVNRTWTVLEQPLVVSDEDPDELWETFLEARAILRRVGGTIQIASQRREVAPDVFITESYVVAYSSFVPVIGRAGDQPPPIQGDGLTAEEREAHFPEPADPAEPDEPLDPDGEAMKKALADLEADEVEAVPAGAPALE